MAKRVASKQMTMDNFDNEDDGEYLVKGDRSTQMASSTAPEKRIIAKARRRSDLNQTTDEPKNVFQGFSGFSNSGFFAAPASESKAADPKKVFNLFENKDNKTSTPLAVNGRQQASEGALPLATRTVASEDKSSFEEQLCQLNRNFVDHLNRNLKQSDCVDFSNNCRDYIDHFQRIQSGSQEASVSSQNSQLSFKSCDTDNIEEYQKSSQEKDFKFTEEKDQKDNEVSDQKNIEADSQRDTEDNDEPPVVESVEHKEPDSVFTKKCKLFFKKGENWCNKGVGFLFIKKEVDNSRPQLLIRADNSLGTILLNIRLTESIPVSKAPQNKGIFLTCVPNPPIDKVEATVAFLIKAKAEEIDEIFDNLVKYKSN